LKIILTQKFKEKILVGRSNSKNHSNFPEDQVQKGIEVELEHSDDRELAKEIAMDHLKEFSNYYKELEKMENKLSENN